MSTLLPFIVAHCPWISSSLMPAQLGHNNQPTTTHSLTHPLPHLIIWPNNPSINPSVSIFTIIIIIIVYRCGGGLVFHLGFIAPPLLLDGHWQQHAVSRADAEGQPPPQSESVCGSVWLPGATLLSQNYSRLIRRDEEEVQSDTQIGFLFRKGGKERRASEEKNAPEAALVISFKRMIGDCWRNDRGDRKNRFLSPVKRSKSTFYKITWILGVLHALYVFYPTSSTFTWAVVVVYNQEVVSSTGFRGL